MSNRCNCGHYYDMRDQEYCPECEQRSPYFKDSVSADVSESYHANGRFQDNDTSICENKLETIHKRREH